MKLRLHVLSILIFACFTSFSQVHTINTAGMTFDPDTVTINLGDTIEFGSLGYHNAVEVDESTWSANDTTYNGGFYFA
ncbi:MAG: cupredoxin domain-containing protein, partial [Flavobacteriales bacterium]